MAENVVKIDSSTPVNMTANTTAATPIFTTPGAPPGQNFYFHALVDLPGVVAATNHLSFFNPVGSGKISIAYQATILPWATGATSADASMTVTRTTAASAGTLVAASAVNRLVTTTPNPVTEVRTGNPTVTTSGTALIGFPPALTTAASGVSSGDFTASPPGAGFVMLPGQGIVFSTALGDVDQRWDIQFIWAEQSL